MMDITAKSRHQDQISSGIDHNRPARTQYSGNMPVHKESVHRLMSKPHLNGITRLYASNHQRKIIFLHTHSFDCAARRRNHIPVKTAVTNRFIHVLIHSNRRHLIHMLVFSADQTAMKIQAEIIMMAQIINFLHLFVCTGKMIIRIQILPQGTQPDFFTLCKIYLQINAACLKAGCRFLSDQSKIRIGSLNLFENLFSLLL